MHSSLPSVLAACFCCLLALLCVSCCSVVLPAVVSCCHAFVLRLLPVAPVLAVVASRLSSPAVLSAGAGLCSVAVLLCRSRVLYLVGADDALTAGVLRATSKLDSVV